MNRANFSIFLLVLTAILVVGQLYLTIPLAGRLADQFLVNVETASWSSTAFGFAYATGFLVFGPLSDRLDRHIILICGLLAMAAATVYLGLTTNFTHFLIGRILQGFVAASFPPVALALVAEILPPHKRASGISLMSFSFLIAAPVSQFWGASMLVPTTKIMLMLAPFYIAVALGLFLSMPHDITNDTMRKSPPAKGHLEELFRNRAVITAWIAALSVLLGFVAFQISTALGAQADQINVQTVRLAGLPPLALSLFAGKLIHRFSPAGTVRTGLICTASGLFIAMLPNGMLPASVLVSAGTALSVPGLIATIAGAAKDHNRGLALSIYTFCLFCGASVAPPITVFLHNKSSLLQFLVPAVFLLTTALVMLLALKKGEPKHA